uniref:Anaphase-promoting complex subunit 4-like WD40 domain-containing protein n=1 Tax=Ditylenchus dipsaci TaxID=166011 RepID=A0A915DZT6_9BILA
MNYLFQLYENAAICSEVAWHDKEAILSIDVHMKISDRLVSADSLKITSSTEAGESSQVTTPEVYKMVTGSMQKKFCRFHRKFDRVLLASGDADGAILIWKVKPSEPDISPSKADIERSLDRCEDLPPNRENWIPWSPDSSLIASVSMDDSVLLHRVDTGKRVWSVRSFRRFPNGIVWDPRGKYLVTMSTDRRFDVLDATKGTRLRCCHKVDLPETLLFREQTLQKRRTRFP